MSGIEPIGAPANAHAHEQRQNTRHDGVFGGAVTHREAVRERLRVDPAAVADRMRAPPPARGDTPNRQNLRQERLAEQDKAAAEREMGRRVDLEV